MEDASSACELVARGGMAVGRVKSPHQEEGR